MRALLFVTACAAALFGACLEPGNPYLAERDNHPPSFVSTDPPPGGTFDKDGAILVTFSERMDSRSVRPGIWLMQGQDRVPTHIELPPSNGIPEGTEQQELPFTVSVSGEQPLDGNTDYVLVLDSVLIDTAGNQLLGPDGGVGRRAMSYRTNP